MPESLPKRRRSPGARGASPAVRTATSPAVRRSAFAALPLVLRILWINWVLAVAVNVPVWMLVDGDGDTYFWPIWLAVPGVVLLGASAAVAAVRTHREPLES